MADAAVVEAPVAGATKTTKEINKERLQKLKEAKARKDAAGKGVADVPGSEASAKAPKVKKEPVEKVIRPCRCGCGGQTSSFFVPGHDARWKGWMKKIELGKMEPKDLPETAQKLYKFTKRGVGFVPTENYDGKEYKPQCALEDVTNTDKK